MKKTILLSCFFLTTFFLAAQPALNWVRPPLGTTKTYTMFQGSMTEPTTGANQVWDYSALIPTPISSGIYTDPATLPASAKNKFPTATYVEVWQMPTTLDKTVIDYYYDCADSLVRLGQQSSGGSNSSTWGNVQGVWKLTFGDSATARSMSLSTGKLEPTSFKYAGYGTLKTKYGTYTNVVMISLNGIRNFFQTTPYFGMLMSIQYTTPTTIAGAYIYSYSAGASVKNDIHSAENVSITANSNQITIGLNEINTGCEVRVLNMMGQTVSQKHINNSDSHSIAIDNVISGVYLVEVKYNNSIKTAKVYLSN
jgi:hypothetical protein